MWFCKKVQIPFEVYAFTNEWKEEIELPYEVKEGVFVIDDKFNLLNLLTSKVNAKTLDHQMLNIWRIAHSFAYRSYFSYPQRLVLSGTPLNESIVSLHQIIPQFKKESGAEKVHCIVLTDGEGNYLPIISMLNVIGRMNLILGLVILILIDVFYVIESWVRLIDLNGIGMSLQTSC